MLTFPFITVPALTAPDEKFLSLLAIVSVELPPDAKRPNERKLCALPDTSLLLLRTSAISSIVLTPVRSTVTELESARVTVKLVADETSDDDKPN